MSETSNSARLPWTRRLLAGLSALALTVPFVVAAWLEPDPTGYGTHRQLGMPPCTMVALFGVRCPSCGMTTAWAYLVRGRILAAFGANVGGVLLGVIAMAAIIWLALAAGRGRWPTRPPSAVALSVVATSLATVMFVDWGVRLLLLILARN